MGSGVMRPPRLDSPRVGEPCALGGKTMIDLGEISNLREFFDRMKVSRKAVLIRFHGLDKNSVEGTVYEVADDFVEIRRQYSQFVCPYRAIRLVAVRE